MPSELRKDPVTDRWVLIAPDRGARPSDFLTSTTRPPVRGICPFCPGNEDLTPDPIQVVEGPDGKWRVRVIPNRYPAVQVEVPLRREAAGIYDRVSGFGAHEVLVETPDHDLSLWELSDEDRARVLAVYRDRLADLRNDRRIRWAMIFKNRGALAGATLHHEHSQLLALPQVPLEAKARWEGARAHYARKERCVYCDVIAFEKSEGVRMVDESRFFVAFCPYASRAPFETWILPREHVSHYMLVTQKDIEDLSDLLGRVLRRIDGALESPAVNFMLHSAPLQEPESPAFHWHLEIVPATLRYGGFEWGSGYYINPTPPEDAAAFLRRFT